MFGYTSLITHEATLDVTVEEDLLAYRFPAAEFQRLLRRRLLRAPLRRGARRAAEVEPHPLAGGHAPGRPLAGRGADPPARRGLGGGGGDGRGGRARDAGGADLLGPRRGPRRPGSSPTATSASASSPRGSGRRRRSRRSSASRSAPCRRGRRSSRPGRRWSTPGVNHLAVERDGELIGVLTSTDLLKCSAQGPVSVLRSVERLAGRDEPPRLRRARRGDGLRAPRRRARGQHHRRVRRAAQRHAPPPDPPVGGGGARAGARAAGPGWTSAPRGGWSRRSSPTRTTPSSTRTRAPRPAAGTSASRTGWAPTSSWPGSPAAPAAAWRAGGTGRCPSGSAEIATASSERPHDAAIFFDYRKVAGELDVAPIDAALARAQRPATSCALLAQGGARVRAAHGLLLRKSSHVDLKARGDLAGRLPRALLRDRGRRRAARNTLERLDAALAGGPDGRERPRRREPGLPVPASGSGSAPSSGRSRSTAAGHERDRAAR